MANQANLKSYFLKRKSSNGEGDDDSTSKKLSEEISPVCFEFLFRFILNARTEIILFQVGSMAMLIKCYLPLQMCFLFVYKLFYFRVYRPPLYVHSCVRRAQVSALFIYFLKLRSRVN